LGFLIPDSVWTAIARTAMAATLWLVRRPFLMSRTRWAALLVLVAGIDILAWLIAPPWLAGAIALVALLIAAVLTHWWWLGRGEVPIVFVSLFEGRSPLGRDAARTHIGALARFLVEDKNLAQVGPLAIRPVSIPLKAKQAERLLRISGALAVVRGSGDAAGDLSRWEWSVCFRDRLPDAWITKYEFSMRTNQARKPVYRRFAPVDHATDEARDIEGDLQLSSFVATNIAVHHFRAVAKTLCVLRSEQLFEMAREEERDSPAILVLPSPTDPDVANPLQGRIAVMEARTELGEEKDHLAVLERMQDLCRSGLGNSRFGVWVETQWYAATVEGWVERPTAYAASEEILSRFPDSVGVAVNTAGMAIRVKDLQRAEELAQLVEELEPDEPSIARLRANLAWERREPIEALALYKKASKSGSPQTWQIGDCYAMLGKQHRALHCYRKVLRKDPTARFALDNARAVLGLPKLLPTQPLGWRSRIWDWIHLRPRLVRGLLWLWRLRLPEDPWLSTWLARHALVVGDLDTARKWIILTTRIGYSNRLIATMDALVVGVIRREGDLPQNVEHLKAHISWLEEQGETEARPNGEDALLLLAATRPDLFNGEYGDEIEAVFSSVGFDVD
jgi:tetratricopeptide (TPR) repeat protein